MADKKHPKISITATALEFEYNEKTRIFNGHELKLETAPEQGNKLYGLIGPSGTGKTTLLSILGGQLKPTKGQIKINDIDIYAVGDYTRRQLIGLQMQSSTSLRGKLRYNLVFGLPTKDLDGDGDVESTEQDIYDDVKLVEVLEKVGLWSLFKDKDGLETLIGEGGLNLSGGQRQRLNFASLYLRSRFYKPVLLLIDEPTSSLDEISEQAITKMMEEMAQDAVAIVIAHRLKTLDQAVGLLDASLFETEKSLNFLSREELSKKSRYYKDLMVGKAQLED
jgi:ABC-type multidrug transport system fused ATPase/permease subunit